MTIAMLDTATLNDDLDLSIFDEFGTVRRYALTAPEELAEHTLGCDVLILNKVKIKQILRQISLKDLTYQTNKLKLSL